VSHPKGPPPEEEIRRRHRDASPALGTRGEPAPWRRAVEGGAVELARGQFGDARSSYLYGDDTGYAVPVDADGESRVAEAGRRMRGGAELPGPVQGPVMHPAVWTWEIPLYFWIGGVASGSSFVAAAADAVGDHRSAAIARRVTLAAVLPTAPLLIVDLGRPERFLNMLRIFKPRSPMSMGAWCLAAFSSLAAGSVAAELVGRDRLARTLGAGTAFLGTYLGSYTGALLASTAVPVWVRSRHLLGPIFIATGAGTGAATNHLVLAAAGLPVKHPTRTALGAVETVAMGAELALSALNEKRLGRVGRALAEGRPGRLLRAARWGVRAGLALRLASRRAGPRAHHLASVLYIASGLAFRFAWVEAGRTSAGDHEAVARAARERPRI
jgi:formate-dependent nitrite reductase membrane component NrfD